MFTAKQTSQAENTAAMMNGKTPFFNSLVQTKMQVNEPGDSHEHEADAMADHVMRMSKPAQANTSFFKPAITGVQRKCQHCEEEDKFVHRKENSNSQPGGINQLDSYVSSLSSSGTALPESSRMFFEPHFGHDFSNVRIHTDQAAARSAQSINALAYTTGNNIVFNSGQFSPESDSGKKLIAHELTHVVQQGGNGIANNNVQRMGNLAKVPPMACDVANSSPNGIALSARFALSSSTITPQQRADIVALVASWRASGGTDTLRVDGYASSPGTDESNWQLSCNRALSVANELRNAGVPDAQINIFAQGETTEFGSQANNQVANVSIIGAPKPNPPSVITSQTVAPTPGLRTRKTIGVGEEVDLTLSSGDASTAWTTTAGSLSAATGATVRFQAPDTSQTVTVTAGTATIKFTIIAPNDVHMDQFPGTGVKHTLNSADSGIETQPFILPDNVNFYKVIYQEIDVKGNATGVYLCNPAAGGHCGHGGTGPCGDLFLTNTVIAGKGTQSVLGDCAYSGHCGGTPPLIGAGSLVLLIPYEYKVGTGPYRRFATVLQIHLYAVGQLSTDKAGAHGATTVSSPTVTIAACP